MREIVTAFAYTLAIVFFVVASMALISIAYDITQIKILLDHIAYR
jgi:hypothetical protein